LNTANHPLIGLDSIGFDSRGYGSLSRVFINAAGYVSMAQSTQLVVSSSELCPGQHILLQQRHLWITNNLPVIIVAEMLVTNNDTLPRATDIDDFLNTTWPPLRKALCGKGAPNLMLANILFKLARSEVFGAKGAAGNTSEAF
jgi:hypothetical protein